MVAASRPFGKRRLPSTTCAQSVGEKGRNLRITRNFRVLGTSRRRAIDRPLSSPYGPFCPKQSNGTGAAGTNRKEGVARPVGKLLGADPPAGERKTGSPGRPGGDTGRLLGTLRLAPKPLGFARSLWDPGERPEWLEDNAPITGHGRLPSGPSGYSGLSLSFYPLAVHGTSVLAPASYGNRTRRTGFPGPAGLLRYVGLCRQELRRGA